ncbi:MAG: hydrogenase maturation protease, partial [Candidatus Aenigmarchaeota archaeon]|nr:hydrogenase maturation protease [Candidatus Aenigmarchaeota archaeon]
LSMGNSMKKDDDIGNIVIGMLKSDAKKMRGDTNPENFIGKISGFDNIILLDAVQFEGNVGEVKAFKLEEVEDRLTSTHSMPIALLKKFYPEAKITVIGIRPKSVDFGEGISDELEEKMDNIVKKVDEIIVSL